MNVLIQEFTDIISLYWKSSTSQPDSNIHQFFSKHIDMNAVNTTIYNSMLLIFNELTLNRTIQECHTDYDETMRQIYAITLNNGERLHITELGYTLDLLIHTHFVRLDYDRIEAYLNDIVNFTIDLVLVKILQHDKEREYFLEYFGEQEFVCEDVAILIGEYIYN